MNSKSISTHRDENYEVETGRVEIFEPNYDNDMDLTIYNKTGKQLASMLISRNNARELAAMLLLAAESKL